MADLVSEAGRDALAQQLTSARTQPVEMSSTRSHILICMATQPSPASEPESGSLLSLAADFQYSQSDWEQSAAQVLRKAKQLDADEPDALVWDRLTRRTIDGIAVPPLGVPALLEQLRSHGRPSRTGPWDVRTHIEAVRGADAGLEAISDLEGGATSLWVRASSPQQLASVLNNILLDVAPVCLHATVETSPHALAQELVQIAAARDQHLHPDTNFGADPVGASIVAGGQAPELTPLKRSADLAVESGVRAIVVDGTIVNDRGASDVQELGYTLATAAAYLRQLVNSDGMELAQVARLIEFRYAATNDQFLTIAKLRAARRLWSQILTHSGLQPTDQPAQWQHVVTARPMMTRFDPWVNMLRTTVAAFAAGVGGANAVTVWPFDAAIGVSDDFARRIARNTSALLIDEAHVARVTDPAGGAYAVEKLTDDLVHAGWDELARIDSAGGVEAVVADGSLLQRIDEVAQLREQHVAKRSKPITGLTEFPNLDEELPQRPPHPNGAWQVRSWGHAFEQLRDTPPSQPVFLATMGSVAAHTARATFAANLFAAGGITTINPGATANVDEILAAYRQAGAPQVVCLVGSQSAYAESGAATVAALREAGAAWVILAGNAPDGVEVDATCAMGINALEFLTSVREKLA